VNLLDGIEIFVRVSDSGSYIKASRELGVSPSTVSKMISRMEEELGIRLINRNTRSIFLTEEGKRFLNRCKSILQQIRDARDELSVANQTPKGKLRVSMPVMTTYFSPLISEFMSANPDIELEVNFSDRNVDVIEDGYDIVLRSGYLTDSRLTSRLIGEYSMRLYASPEYISKKGSPQSVEDLTSHDCLLYRFPGTGKTECWPVKSESDKINKINTCFISNNTDIQKSLVLEGKGIALLPAQICREEVNAGKLVPLLEDKIFSSDKAYLLWPKNKNLSQRVRAFVNFFNNKIQ